MIFQNNDQDYPPGDNAKYSTCLDCDGTGYTDDGEICDYCFGSGLVWDEDVEPDWDDIRDERRED